MGFLEFSQETAPFSAKTLENAELLLEVFEKLRDFPVFFEKPRDFQTLQEFSQFLAENLEETDSKTAILLRFLAILPVSASFPAIVAEISREIDAKIAVFQENCENFKVFLRSGLRNLHFLRKRVRKTLENRRGFCKLRTLYEFLNKLQLKVCVTNLSSRKGYFQGYLEKSRDFKRKSLESMQFYKKMCWL